MNFCASAKYRKARRDSLSRRGRMGVEARNRMRQEQAVAAGMVWRQFETLLRWSVSPDGRYVGLQIGECWEVCGTERTVRAKLARAMWRKAKKTKEV